MLNEDYSWMQLENGDLHKPIVTAATDDDLHALVYMISYVLLEKIKPQQDARKALVGLAR